LTQDTVARRAGISQPMLSRIELGRGAGLPLATWVAVGEAVGVDVIAPAPTPDDWGHTSMVALASVGGWKCASTEPFVLRRDQRLIRDHYPPRMSSGELAVVLVIDVVTDVAALLDDLRAAVHSTRRDGPAGWLVSGLLVLRRTPDNKRRLTESRPDAASALSWFGTRWLVAFRSAAVCMPVMVGWLWMDHRATRLIPVRLAASAA
jgi:hypothetical protein